MSKFERSVVGDISPADPSPQPQMVDAGFHPVSTQEPTVVMASAVAYPDEPFEVTNLKLEEARRI